MIQTRVEIVENILMMILLLTEPCYGEILVWRQRWIQAYDIRVTSVGKFSLRKDKNGAFILLVHWHKESDTLDESLLKTRKAESFKNVFELNEAELGVEPATAKKNKFQSRPEAISPSKHFDRNGKHRTRTRSQPKPKLTLRLKILEIFSKKFLSMSRLCFRFVWIPSNRVFQCYCCRIRSSFFNQWRQQIVFYCDLGIF